MQDFFLLHHIISGKMREFLPTEEQNYAPQQYSQMKLIKFNHHFINSLHLRSIFISFFCPPWFCVDCGTKEACNDAVIINTRLLVMRRKPPKSEAEACPSPVLGWVRKGSRPSSSGFRWRKVVFHADAVFVLLKRSCCKGQLKNANEIVKH